MKNRSLHHCDCTQGISVNFPHPLTDKRSISKQMHEVRCTGNDQLKTYGCDWEAWIGFVRLLWFTWILQIFHIRMASASVRIET